MGERYVLSVQAHRRLLDSQRRLITVATVGQVERVANDGMLQMPQVNANLMGSTRLRFGFDDARAVVAAPEHMEFGLC